jgi:hypothetical protein
VRDHDTKSDLKLVALGTVPIAIVVPLLIAVADMYDSPGSGWLPDYRPLLLCISLVGMSVISYVAWPSRWNVIAHGQVAFSIVAYVIPILILGRLDGLSSDAVDLYYKVTLFGFLAMFTGVLIGKSVVGDGLAPRLSRRAGFDKPEVSYLISSRTLKIAIVAVAMVCVAFAVMGFVPMLADNPFEAKFFRGPYAAAYAPVAPLYRFGTTAIALLLPLIGAFAWKSRSIAWVGLFAMSAGVMFLGLMRDPAVTGILLLIGLMIAARGRGLPLYFALLIGVYFIGSSLYFLLSKLGLPGFGLQTSTATGLGQRTFLDEVSAGAPDVTDQMTFLRAWMTFPQYTDGRTWVGGLIPGNYPWNPSVWSLSVVNPGVPISEITSGGLRLPAPIWGLVSFGWPGVIAVSLLSGIALGFLARLASRLVPSTSLVTSVCWLLVYAAALDVFPVFYRLSYLSVIQLGIVVVLLFWGTRRLTAPPKPKSAPTTVMESIRKARQENPTRP